MPSDVISDSAKVRAILDDPGYIVPPAPAVAADETGTLGWLRAHVARFSDGEVHAGRRALAESELAGLDPAALRAAAAERTRAELAAAGSAPVDAMSLARRVPVAVLAAGLGLTGDTLDAATGAVVASASGYPNPDQAGPYADVSVGFLAGAVGPAGNPEALANRIGLMMQASDATAGLIGNALIAAFTDETQDVDEVIAATLRDDPPVLRTRRLSPEGEVVTLDISGCTFGAGRRPCPGADQATALAAGVLDAILPTCELADQQIHYVPSPSLRIPAELLITVS